MLPPSVSWYFTPSASSLSTMALASSPARLPNSGAYVGALAQREEREPAEQQPDDQQPADDALGGGEAAELGLHPTEGDLHRLRHQPCILMISLNASSALFRKVTVSSVVSSALVAAIM